MAKVQWKHVGNVSVDAGCLTLIDPCYLMSRAPQALGTDPYSEVLADGSKLDASGVQPVGKNDLGLVVRTGWGDGPYPVVVRYDGARIAEVRVLFMDPAPGDEEVWPAGGESE